MATEQPTGNTIAGALAPLKTGIANIAKAQAAMREQAQKLREGKQS